MLTIRNPTQQVGLDGGEVTAGDGLREEQDGRDLDRRAQRRILEARDQEVAECR